MYTALREFIEDTKVFQYVQPHMNTSYRAMVALSKNRVGYLGDFLIKWRLPKDLKLDKDRVLFQDRPIYFTECDNKYGEYYIKGTGPVPMEVVDPFIKDNPDLDNIELKCIYQLGIIDAKEVFMVNLHKNKNKDNYQIIYQSPQVQNVTESKVKNIFPHIQYYNKCYCNTILEISTAKYRISVLKRGRNYISLQKLR